tara:strand:+ start:107 stop:1681 length:1575 start_codon:yes stop_codon:yes gene_type:complete
MAVTSTGYEINKQPIAQSFYVDETNGIYVTKVDLFFAQKDSTLPVQIQLRPMVNGFPSASQIIPGSIVVKNAVDVVEDTSGPTFNATTFEFAEPIYLKGREDYALVVVADSKLYQIYIAEINEFVKDSTEKRINKQPVLGSLFYSQNGATFTAAQNQDLAFNIYQAKFKTQNATAILHNASLPLQLLDENPITTKASSTEIQVKHINSGFQVGNVVKISGCDSGVGGLSAASINGDRTITKVDWTGYTFDAASSATDSAVAGGSLVKATKNIPFSLVYPHTATLQPKQTFLSAGIKATTARSYAGSETSFQKQTSFSDVKLNENNTALNRFLVAYDSAEVSELGSGVKSLDFSFKMATIDSNVSPMIDLQRTSVSLVDNMIDKQTSSPATGFNVPLNIVDETEATGGSHASRHFTRVVQLANDAVGLRVLLTANRPSAADFQVYFRTGTSDENIEENAFTLATQENTITSDENPVIYREYSYLIGGQGGSLPAFTKFQFKIVMRSTNQARVPRIKDMRVIALSV